MRSFPALSAMSALTASGCIVDVAEQLVGGGDEGGGEDDGEGEGDTPQPPDGWFGLVVTPRHGDVLAGATDAIPLVFHGYHHRAGAELSIQVLADPRDL